jgi:hypothetical protein
MLRDANTGDLQVYDIFDNEIVDSAPLGMIGLQWQFSGIGNFGSSGNSDLLVRNSNTGELEVNNISNNEITGSESLGTMGASTAQLVQAMAGFGGSGAAISNTAPLGADTSQQPLLTTPQHA